MISEEGADLLGRDLRGNIRWRKPFPHAEVGPMGYDAASPRTLLGIAVATDPRVIVVRADGGVEILNSDDGKRIGEQVFRSLAVEARAALALDGTVYFVANEGERLRIDAMRAGKYSTVYSDDAVSRQTRVVACFTGLLCFAESDGTVVALNASTWSVVWRTKLPGAVGVEPAGGLLFVHVRLPDSPVVPRFAVLDPAGRQLGSTTVGDSVPMPGTQGSVLRPATTGPVGNVSLLGLASDGRVGDLGAVEIGGGCAADPLYLICQTPIGFSYWTYRK